MQNQSAKKETQIQKDSNFEKYFAEHKHYFDMKCDHCPKVFESFEEAKSHYASEHRNPQGYIRCCGLKIKFRYKVKEHLKRHLDPDSLK